jgi:Phosphoesterase family
MRLLSRVLLASVAVLATSLAAGAGSSPSTAQLPASAARAQPSVTKLLVFVEENHSLNQMKAGMPYTFRLAKQFGYATDYHAITHPSLPNYIAIAGGQTYGIHDDRLPAYHRLSGTSVFGQALRHHRSAATYAESMPARCSRSDRGRYAPKHNPWTYFVRERTGCTAHDRAMTAFADAARAGTLPRVGMVVPNLCHDAHDCSLATADSWFRSQMTKVFAGPDWRSGRLAVVLTADEDDHTQGNKVLTVVIHGSQHGHVVSTRLTHYSLTRLYDEVAGLPYLHNAATAPSMARAFGLRLG